MAEIRGTTLEPRPICRVCSDEIPGLDAASVCLVCFGIFHADGACSGGDKLCAACIKQEGRAK